jgi:hypothetical protein
MAGAANGRPRRTQLPPEGRETFGREKAEREGFEPSTHLLGTHAISSRAPSANSDTSPRALSVPLAEAKEGVGWGNPGFPHPKKKRPRRRCRRGLRNRALGRAEPCPLRAGRRPARGHGTALCLSGRRTRLLTQWNHLTTLRMFENSSVHTGWPGLVSSGFQRGSLASFPSAAMSRATRTQIELAAPSRASARVTT